MSRASRASIVSHAASTSGLQEAIARSISFTSSSGVHVQTRWKRMRPSGAKKKCLGLSTSSLGPHFSQSRRTISSVARCSAHVTRPNFEQTLWPARGSSTSECGYIDAMVTTQRFAAACNAGAV